MIVYVCDTCEKIVPENALSEGQGRKKNGEVICKECLQAKKSDNDLIFCDRCEKKIPPDLLRKGEALLVPDRSGKKGKIYCTRCRSYGERTSREVLDLKYLVAVFILFLGIPLTIGLAISFNQRGRQLSPAAGTDSSSQDALDDIKKQMRKQQEILEQLQKGSQSEIKSPEKKKIVSYPENKKSVFENPPTVKNKTSTRSYVSLVEEVERKSVKVIERKFQAGSLSAKLQALGELARTREHGGIPLLMKALDEDDPLIKSFSAKILGSLGARESTSKLFSLVSDPNPIVRKSAGQSLQILTGEPVVHFDDLSEEQKKRIEDMIKGNTEK